MQDLLPEVWSSRLKILELKLTAISNKSKTKRRSTKAKMCNTSSNTQIVKQELKLREGHPSLRRKLWFNSGDSPKNMKQVHIKCNRHHHIQEIYILHSFHILTDYSKSYGISFNFEYVNKLKYTSYSNSKAAMESMTN